MKSEKNTDTQRGCILHVECEIVAYVSYVFLASFRVSIAQHGVAKDWGIMGPLSHQCMNS